MGRTVNEVVDGPLDGGMKTLDLGAHDLEALAAGEYRDTKSRLLLRVRPSGARTLSVLFWHRALKRRVRLTLPPNGKRLAGIVKAREIAADPESAYRAATDLRDKDTAQRDARDARRQLQAHERAARAEERKALALEKARASGPTVAGLADRWLRREEARFRESTARGYSRALRIIEADDELNALPVEDLTRLHVSAFRERVRGKHKLRTANDVTGFLGTVLAAAADAGEIKANVIVGMRHLKGEADRDHVLTPDELRKVLNSASEIGGSAGLAVLLALHTCARLNEIIQAPWAEFDLGKKLWSLPASRNKSKRDFLCPLSRGAMDALHRAKARSGTSPWVFPSPAWADAPLATIQQPLRILRQGSCTEGWVFHDLRRTARKLLRGVLRFPEDVAEACVNHGKAKLVATYDPYSPHDLLDEKRAALDALAVHYTGLGRVAGLVGRKLARKKVLTVRKGAIG